MRWLGVLALALALGGCIGAFPDEALQGVERRLTVTELRAAPMGTYVNARVVLGGEILETRPKVGETEVEVLARPLRSDDSPARTDASTGRFLARSRNFLDPAVFAPGRRLTVLGTLAGGEERPLGALPYAYPVVEVEQVRLWALDPMYPGYYGPYWGPYWGWGVGFNDRPYWRSRW
jgi:outer membrane lipoprotein